MATILTQCLVVLVTLGCVCTNVVPHIRRRSLAIRIQEVMRECNCPNSCMLRLKVCLGNGECTACKIPTYGKRSTRIQEDFHYRFFPSSLSGTYN